MSGDLRLSEAQLQAAIIDLATALGWAHYHTHDSRRSVAGFPDLILAGKDRRMIAAELKSQHGIVTAAQTRWLGLLDAVPGVEAYLWRPAEWFSGEIEEILR